MRGRFAPSPTGDLHLGGAFVAIAAFVRARARGSALVLRMEDLDLPRVVEGAAERILDDLRWLGVDWDEGPRVGGPHRPYEQSLRAPLYDAAVDELLARGLAYPCTCSRAEIARASSAPHAGEEGPRYPGTCRDPGNRRADRAAATRLRVDETTFAFDDLFAGHREENVAERVGDFVLRRADGATSYQLAVVVDDLAMEIDEVLRGEDLLASTARQLLLARALGAVRVPRYGHLPLVRGPDGERLAKRHQSRWTGSTVRELRESGVASATILGEIGAALGLLEHASPTSIEALTKSARAFDPRPWTPPGAWFHPRTPA